MLKPLFKLLRFLFIMTLVCIVYLTLRIPILGKFLKNLILDALRRQGIENIDAKISLDLFKYWWKCFYNDMYYRQAFLQETAPNPEVYVLSDKSIKNLIDFQNGNRPLILNFGSCS